MPTIYPAVFLLNWGMFLQLLPAVTKLWPRLCFYSCLWFYPQLGGGVSLSACLETTPWGAHPPPGADIPQSRPPRSRHPPGSEPPGADPSGADIPTPQEQTPPRADTPPWSRHPPEQTPPPTHPGADTPPEQTPPCSRHPSPPTTRADTPPRKQTPPYSQWVAGTHPTGMHSCLASRNLNAQAIILMKKWTCLYRQRC